MKENEDKNMEQFIGRVMKETPLESPSYNFTSKVMANVLAVDKSKATVYKPIISQKGWVLIFAGIIAVLLYLLLSDQYTGCQPFLAIRSFRKKFHPDIKFLKFISILTVNRKRSCSSYCFGVYTNSLIKKLFE